jgi:glycosyltransferase involved in cell wall biosynthesis
MEQTSLVSVIIPVYNCERYLAEAIESVLAQTYRPIEIIVVDDGSTDSTASIATSFKGDVRYVHQPNGGPAAARNRGLKLARGNVIAFLDADDLWTPNKLSLQVDCLLKHPHIGYTLARQRNFLEPGTDRPAWLRKELLLKDYVGTLQTLVARRKVFEQVGVFDPTFRINEDMDWFARAKDAGIPMIVVPEVLAYRRIHSTNLGYQAQVGDPVLFRTLRASIRRKGNRRPTEVE